MIPNHRSAFMRNALKYMKCGMTEIQDNARPRRVVNCTTSPSRAET